MATRFVRFDLTPEIFDDARARASRTPVYSGSHRGLDANMIGHLGEVVVERWLRERGFDVRTVGAIEHDMMVVDPQGGPSLSIEIKTKDRTVRPLSRYEATVPKYVYDKQSPDHYVFVSLYRERASPRGAFSEAYIVGSISRSRFDKCRHFEAAGPKPNGAMFFCDAWNIHIAELDEPDAFPPWGAAVPPT